MVLVMVHGVNDETRISKMKEEEEKEKKGWGRKKNKEECEECR